MIVGLAIGGVIGGVVIDALTDDSSYSDYSNHSDYSDAAYKRNKRIEEKNREISMASSDLEEYKATTVNHYLMTEKLIAQSGENISDTDLDKDAKKKIENKMADAVKQKAMKYQQELEEIDQLLEIIERKV